MKCKYPNTYCKLIVYVLSNLLVYFLHKTISDKFGKIYFSTNKYNAAVIGSDKNSMLISVPKHTTLILRNII